MATRKRSTSSRKVTKRDETSVISTEPVYSKSQSSSVSATDTRPLYKRPLILTLGAVILIVGLLYLFRDRFIAATVNGQVIPKAELLQDLEKQYGAQALDNLITKAVVEQEAKKRNITISNEEIDSEIAEIENRFTEQQQNLDDVLASQGYTRAELRDQIQLQLLVERMVADKIAVTDEEVAKYIEHNKDFLPTGVPEEEQKTNAQEDLKQEKINQEAQTLLQELKSNADIKYFSNEPAAPAMMQGQ